MKKLCAFFLALVLVLGMLPPVHAEELSPEEAIIQEARTSYRRSLGSAGKDSFHGFCGLMVSHQLRQLGINDWCIINDGKNQFDYYRNMEVTGGGYYITPYSAEDYSLLGALKTITRNGTQNARNLMVGFQWTNTEAGAQYGHVVLINAILDGVVYFVESFDLQLNGRHPEGSVITCSMEEFAAYFDRWTIFEGIINFGTGSYSDACQTEGTDLFVMCRFESVLRSQPCLVGENDCIRLRQVQAGERLRATAICTAPDGKRYYRIDDGGQIGYIAAGAAGAVRVNPEGMFLQDARIPDLCRVGDDFSLGGTVVARYAGVSSVEVRINDSTGQPVLREQALVNGPTGELSLLNDLTRFDLLEQGYYYVEVWAEVASPVVMGQDLDVRYQSTRLWSQLLQVGGGMRITKAHPIQLRPVQQTREGWVWEDGSWYCYRDGRPLLGWVSYCGVQYYMDENGAALTGWQNVDGDLRFFSATGAMVTGWLTEDGITTYRLADGSAAVGWQEIRGGQYYFAEDGALVTGGEMSRGDKVFILGEDGKAIEKVEGQVE